MKLTTEIDGERCEVQLRFEGTRVLAEVDGRSYGLEARAAGQGFQLLLLGGRVYECRVQTDAARRELREVHLGGSAYEVTVIDPKRLRGSQSAAGQADGAAQLVAPMPGKIVRVLVEEGAEVRAGDGVVVVEAMKMQNEMKSPRNGTVTLLRAQTGNTVSAGEVLAVIE